MTRPVAGSRALVLVLIALGAAALLFAACVVQPAPTPNVEELAQALARTWATQTAQAAPDTGAASVTTMPASATPASTLPATLPTRTLPPTDTRKGKATSPPTVAPSVVPTRKPTSLPTRVPSATPTAVSTPLPSPTPSVTPTPACAIPVDAELAALWDRAILGCPGMRAQVIPATWQQFEHGYILWKSDQERTFVLGFANETDPWQGAVIANSPGWQWDGISFPNGRGLTPPPGLLEPVGRLGFVWFEKLGGPSSGLGWATAPAQELCLTMQPAAGGFVAKTNPRPCSGVKNQSLESLFIRIRADGTWQRRPEIQPPTRTPTVTPQCAIPPDPRLASAWERRELGCAKSGASVIWAAWQPFEQGSMIWRADKDRTYALYFAGGTDATRGEWVTGGDSWRWDGSFPAGRGLTPPPGRYEPVRGFGLVWFEKLGGPSSQLGWATEPEKGICATLQPFDGGLIFASNHDVETCENGGFNRAREPDFTPVVIALKDDGNWRR